MLSTKSIKENILAIEYPGIVQNVDYVLNTLGGLTNISKVVIAKAFSYELQIEILSPTISTNRRAAKRRNVWI